MRLEFTGEVITWRGPSPYYFVAVPEEECAQLHAASSSVTYGWGMIPVAAGLGDTAWTTSLFPKDDGYVVPLKADVRRSEHLALGDVVTVRLELSV